MAAGLDGCIKIHNATIYVQWILRQCISHKNNSEIWNLQQSSVFNCFNYSASAKNYLSINAYGAEDEKKFIYPLRVTDAIVPGRHVDLLLHERNGDQHYSKIKNVSRLISGQLSNHGHAIYCCKKCLHAYSTKEQLTAHAVDCCHVQRTKFPQDPRCRFTNIQKQLSAPFVVYADFESILKPVNEGVDVTQGVSTGAASSATVYQEHVLLTVLAI